MRAEKTAAWRRRLAQWAAVLLILVALVSLGQKVAWARRLWGLERVGTDQVATWEQRMTQVKADLQGERLIGYLSEVDFGLPNDPIDTNTEFTLTQYVLAPTILQRGAEADQVICNLGEKGYKPEYGARMGLILAGEYGNGIYLLRKAAK
ncbi:MAG TPA: hypothetical protein VIO61_04355 [Anaerolineaceae bacterium]